MTTFERELRAQCEALLPVFAAAHVPCYALPDLLEAPDRFIALRPALRALRVRVADQRWIEHHVREEPTQFRALCVREEPAGVQYLLVQLHALMTLGGDRGRHPVCTQFAVWHHGVTSAFLTHGYYDPLTNHTPPAERQLDAIECREHGRALLNDLVPGLGTAFGWAGAPPDDDEEEEGDDC